MADKIVKIMYSDKHFNDELKKHGDSAKDWYENHEGKEMPPSLYVDFFIGGQALDKNGLPKVEKAVFVIADGFEDHDSKRKTLFGCGKEFVEKGLKDGKRFTPLSAFLVTEAWGVFGKDKEELQKTAPSKHPEKVEIVCIVGKTIDNRSNFSMYEIMRYSSGVLKSLNLKDSVEYEGEDSGNVMESDLIDMFFAGAAEEIIRTTETP